MTQSAIISKVWNFANILKDDGVGYGDYLEQITYLLFLKLADEYSKPPYNRDTNIPKDYNWDSLSSKRGAALEGHYIILLRELAKQPGILGQIFVKSQNKIQDPAKLFKIIDMINKEEWAMMGTDLKGKIYEGLLEKNAEDTKSGAGEAQYWSLKHPMSSNYASNMGIPKGNINNANFISTGTLKNGGRFITRPAPAVGSNLGGGIEVVVPPGGVNMNTFSVIK